ncbi:MAG: hypothetical protein WDO13_10905 [Verrucomicrobiota bacterium]
MSRELSRKLGFALILAFWALVGLTDYPVPFIDDLFYIGAALNLAQHGVFTNPYADMLATIGCQDHFFANMPLHDYVLAGWLRLFGISALSFHVLYTLLALGVSLLIFRFVATARHAWLAAIFIAAAVYGLLGGTGLRADALGLFFLLAGFDTWRAETPAGFLWRNVFLGLVIITFPNVALPAILLSLFGLVHLALLQRRSLRELAPFVLALAAAYAGVLRPAADLRRRPARRVPDRAGQEPADERAGRARTLPPVHADGDREVDRGPGRVPGRRGDAVPALEGQAAAARGAFLPGPRGADLRQSRSLEHELGHRRARLGLWLPDDRAGDPGAGKRGLGARGWPIRRCSPCPRSAMTTSRSRARWPTRRRAPRRSRSCATRLPGCSRGGFTSMPGRRGELYDYRLPANASGYETSSTTGWGGPRSVADLPKDAVLVVSVGQAIPTPRTPDAGHTARPLRILGVAIPDLARNPYELVIIDNRP